MTTTDSRLIVALDFPAAAPALAFVQQLSPDSCRVKVGKELFTAAGPALVKELVQQGYSVFLDLKFHDIPHTVAAAVTAAAELGVWMVNVHASGGSTMMREAAQALQRFGNTRPLLTAVTVLTSMQQSDLAETGITEPLADRVLRLAKLAAAAGLDGVVCSGEEAPLLRNALGKDFCLVTPGIRPASAAKDDQKRVLTPAQAIANGSSYLVVGRPITQAHNPQAAIRTINEEITYAVHAH